MTFEVGGIYEFYGNVMQLIELSIAKHDNTVHSYRCLSGTYMYYRGSPWWWSEENIKSYDTIQLHLTELEKSIYGCHNNR